jgi:hypothetical protein
MQPWCVSVISRYVFELCHIFKGFISCLYVMIMSYCLLVKHECELAVLRTVKTASLKFVITSELICIPEWFKYLSVAKCLREHSLTFMFILSIKPSALNLKWGWLTHPTVCHHCNYNIMFPDTWFLLWFWKVVFGANSWTQ